MRNSHEISIPLLFLFFTLLTFPSIASADAWSTFRTPLVEAPSGARTNLGDTYDRYTYPVMAGNLFIWIDEFYLPNDGDIWQVRLVDLNNSDDSAVYELWYDGQTDCLVDMFGGSSCGATEGVEDGVVHTWNLLTRFGTQCISENRWAMSGTYNAAYLGASPHDFATVPFTPGVPVVELDRQEFAPFVPATEDDGPGGPYPRSIDPGIRAERVNITLKVFDDLSCNYPLDDELIEVRAEIVPESGSHEHFSEEGLAGTGKVHFQDLRPFDEDDNPATLQFEMLYKEEKLAYTAGMYGVRERISFEALEARAPAVSTREVEITVAAAAGELVNLDGQGDWYDVIGGASSCDTSHNVSETERNSDYLLPFAHTMATALAYDFFDRTGLRLKFNDASLANGGFFDNGSENREAKCHYTHRVGIDVDLNTQPTNPGVCDRGTGPLLETCKIVSTGYPESNTALNILDQLAEKDYGAHFWRKHDRESSPFKLHYRFPR